MNTILPRPADAVIAAARDFLGERMSTNASVREQHSRGEDSSTPTLPDAVAFVETTAEVSRLLALCHAHGVPVVPFGAGTSLEGHVNPVRGGISLDLSRMTAILEVNEQDMDCVIEPGVTRHQLNDHLRAQGLFFPVDPGSHCTIGGMVATRASGTNAVRYGTIRENVLGLEVVLADGRVIATGGRTRKAANGYDLSRLLIGSGGHARRHHQVRLRLHGIPEAMSAAVCQFPPASAVETVIRMQSASRCAHRAAGRDMMAASAYSSWRAIAGRPPVPRVPRQRGRRRRAGRGGGGASPSRRRGLRWATTPRSATAGKARHDAYWAGIARPAGRRSPPMSACRLSACEALVGATGGGGAGPRDLHRRPCRRRQLPPDGALRPERAGALERAWEMDKRIVARGMALGGTCSGEHGIGLGKREFLEQEHGVEALAVMRSIKAALDPKGIMNPGKIFRN
jgi:D-lactate dehydrogenase (cytochrome)